MAIMTRKSALAELKRHLKGFAGFPIFQQPEALSRMQELWDMVNRVKEYVKTVFKPAKNIDELRQRYNKSEMLEKFDVSKSARLDTCNAGFEAMTEVTDRFEMSRPMSFFGSQNESPFRGSKIKKNVFALYTWVRRWGESTGGPDAIIFPVSTSLPKVEQNKKAANDYYNRLLDEHKVMVSNNHRASDEVKRRAEKLTKWRWSVSENFKGTMHHEMGHMIHLRGDTPELDELARENYINGWPLLISQYALHNHKEYFAETFAAYMAGEHEFIEPRLLAVLKELDKAA